MSSQWPWPLLGVSFSIPIFSFLPRTSHLTPLCLPCYSETRGMGWGMEMIDSKDCSIHPSSIAWTPYSHSRRVLATSLLRGSSLESPPSPDFPEMVVESVSGLSLFCASPLLCSYRYHFLLQRVFPDPEIEPGAPALHGDSLLTEPPGKPCLYPGELYFYLHREKTNRMWVTWKGPFHGCLQAARPSLRDLTKLTCV